MLLAHSSHGVDGSVDIAFLAPRFSLTLPMTHSLGWFRQAELRQGHWQ